MKADRFRIGKTARQVLNAFAILFGLAVIAAFLFPMFQTVRENGGPNCQTNLKQLGLAYVQYSQDADELYPAGVNATGNGWAGQIYPFIKAVGVYQCPEDKQEGKYISYAENQNVVGQSLGKFANPAGTVELYETTTLNCDPAIHETVSATGLSAPQDSKRHDAKTFGLYFLAADGHVKWLKPEQVSSGPSAIMARKIGGSKYDPFVMTFAIK